MYLLEFSFPALFLQPLKMSFFLLFLPPSLHPPQASPHPLLHPEGPFRAGGSWKRHISQKGGESHGPAQPRTELLSQGSWLKLPSREINRHKKKGLLCLRSRSYSFGPRGRKAGT